MLSDKKPKRRIVIVTGLSGAGMSSALKVLEDNGYEVFDNFPLSLFDPLLKEKGYEDHPIAIGFDSRSRGFDPSAIAARVESLQEEPDISATLLYLTANDGTLHKRFMETRRFHPQARDRSVQDGIDLERAWLRPLLDDADQVIDTSEFSTHDLRRHIEGSYQTDPMRQNLSINIVSFGFKHGVPREANLVFDVRFLKNPYWDRDLRDLTGHDESVIECVRGDPAFEIFMTKLRDMLEFLLPLYMEEGKHYLTLAIGCTGGQHRSVYISELLAKDIAAMGLMVSVRHRDL